MSLEHELSVLQYAPDWYFVGGQTPPDELAFCDLGFRSEFPDLALILESDGSMPVFPRVSGYKTALFAQKTGM